MKPFELDPQLGNDTHFITQLGLCRLLLMDDARFPWLVMVPQRGGVTEIHELSPLDQTMLTFETVTVSQRLKAMTDCDKINVASLGNQVPQLHVHVIARTRDDAAWPRPVWGVGTPKPYRPGAIETFIAEFVSGLQ